MRGKAKARSLASAIGKIAAILLVGLASTLVSAAPAKADRTITYLGPYMIFNKSGSGCLVPDSLATGAKIYAWNGCYTNSFEDMKWILWISSDGGFYIQNNMTERCIIAPNNSINTTMTLGNLGSCSSPNARWYFTDPSLGVYTTMQNAVSGLCATAEETSRFSEPVVQWYCMTQYTDLWWIFLPAF